MMLVLFCGSYNVCFINIQFILKNYVLMKTETHRTHGLPFFLYILSRLFASLQQNTKTLAEALIS